MVRQPLRTVSLWGGLMLAASAPLSAQWFPGGGPGCDCPAPVLASADLCPPVACVQPVMQTCYQTVPVTEFQPVRQTVKKPVWETKYVDQQVTEYEPVTEQRTANVPTVHYQDVVEQRQICRNVGHYVTRCEPVCKVSPCEYDNRPGPIGWLNRTGYEFTSMFTPNYRVRREYVPQTIVENVPVTRRVAVQGTRPVAYNVTTMVAKQVSKRVAVNTLTYRDEEITVMRPTTVMKTVPVGTAMAFGPVPFGASRTALGPTPDPLGSRPRSADALKTADPNKFEREKEAANPAKDPRTSFRVPNDDGQVIPARGAAVTSEPARHDQTVPSATPSIVRASRWVARSSQKLPENESLALSVPAGN